jgi:hypothetical protein
VNNNDSAEKIVIKSFQSISNSLASLSAAFQNANDNANKTKRNLVESIFKLEQLNSSLL